MDQIQKTLIKMGRKDLAQQYYLKVTNTDKKEMLTKEVMKWKKDYPNYHINVDKEISGRHGETFYSVGFDSGYQAWMCLACSREP